MRIGEAGFEGVDPSYYLNRPPEVELDGPFDLPERAGAPGKWDTDAALSSLGVAGKIPSAIRERAAGSGSYPSMVDFHGQDQWSVISAMFKGEES